MSVHAGSILTVGGNNVVDRIQSAGVTGDVPMETIREVGNFLIVDKVPGEPDFTFTIESLDVSTDLMALLTGKVGAVAEPAGAPGAADAAGTAYRWADTKPLSIASPWKDPNRDLTGEIVAGHLIPGYYPTRLRYRFGVTDNATQEVELGGGSYYYAASPPVEEYATGDGAETDYVTSEGTVQHRRGGPAGTTFRNVFGVIVGSTLMVEGVDYSVTGGDGTPATIVFVIPPPATTLVRFSYFTVVAKAYPQAVHASTVVKPGAVRGRNIVVFLGAGGARQRIGGIQTLELEATVDGAMERELGTEEVIGRQINGIDATGTITARARDHTAFMGLLSKVTGVATDEVIGFLNTNPVPLEVQIQNPKNPAQILKTLYIPDAMFQIPGTPARVNAPTDFAFRFESQTGDFTEYKGAKP